MFEEHYKRATKKEKEKKGQPLGFGRVASVLLKVLDIVFELWMWFSTALGFDCEWKPQSTTSPVDFFL